ncbi:unnamed protein product [Cunninghamella blakesleeana]
MESVKVFQHKKFLATITEIIDSRFLSTGQGKVVRVLDIGCGPGDFLTLLKDHFKEKIEVIGLDPSEKDIKEAKTKSSEIKFYQSGIIDWYHDHKDEKFDLVMFTKSLHHCEDLDTSIRNAYDLLLDGGLLLADEMNFHELDDVSIYWLYERWDLLKAAGRLNPGNKYNHYHEHHHEKHGHHHHQEQQHEHDHHHHHHQEQHHGHDHHGHDHHGENHFEKMLDATIDPVTRFNVFKKFPHIHQPKDVVDAFKSIFDVEKIKFDYNIPFMYYMLMPIGLEDNEVGKAILSQFLAQEERAIANGTIKAVGFRIMVDKA